MQDFEVSEIVEFVNLVEGFDLIGDTVLFRGQPLSGNLLPAIARGNPLKDTTDQEKEMLEQLRLMGATLLNGNDNDDWDLLVKAQHFGMSTRLLDWTSNPLAALWFACNDKESGDAFVYALDAETLYSKGVRNTSPFEQRQTVVFQPKLNNPRILAQHGWFTVHRYSASNKRYVALEKNKNISQHLYEFKVPESSRSALLKSLDRYGINSKSLFPDLEGLCNYLNWKNALHNKQKQADV